MFVVFSGTHPFLHWGQDLRAASVGISGCDVEGAEAGMAAEGVLSIVEEMSGSHR